LSGNIAEGTMFYAGSQICDCSDLENKDQCNVLWTHCEYGVSIIDISEKKPSCFTVIKKPLVLACKELPMLSVPLNEFWGVVRDVQFLRKREKKWKFPTWNYTYFVEFRNVYGAEPFFIRFYLKPHQTRENCTVISVDVTTTILLAEVYATRLGRKVVDSTKKSNKYFSVQLSDLTACSNYCQSCWHSFYFGKDYIVAGDTIVVEFICNMPAIRSDKIPDRDDDGIFWVDEAVQGFYVDKVMIDYKIAGENLTPYANCDTNCTNLRILKPFYTPVQGSKRTAGSGLKWTVDVPGLDKGNSRFMEDGTITASMDEIIVSSKVDSKRSLLVVKVNRFSVI